MLIKMNRQVTVNAPANKSWRVIAHEFEEIERWSSGIKVSKAANAEAIPEGAAVGGRYCDTVQEKFTHYDEQGMHFGYEMVDPPWFIRSIGNNWQVRSLGLDKSIIEMAPEINCNPLVGLLLLPLTKLFAGIVADRTFEEVTHYIEHDEPHPRKVKAMQKQMKTV